MTLDGSKPKASKVVAANGSSRAATRIVTPAVNVANTQVRIAATSTGAAAVARHRAPAAG